MERHYQNSTSDSAMTEIALALAMGFFSIMVLTMVSMGAVGASSAQVGNPIISAVLQTTENNSVSKAQLKADDEDQLVIFYQGRFYGQDLKPTSPAMVDLSKRLILAVSPDLEMLDALNARTQFNTQNLIISTLNEEWMMTLRRTIK